MYRSYIACTLIDMDLVQEALSNEDNQLQNNYFEVENCENWPTNLLVIMENKYELTSRPGKSDDKT